MKHLQVIVRYLEPAGRADAATGDSPWLEQDGLSTRRHLQICEKACPEREVQICVAGVGRDGFVSRSVGCVMWQAIDLTLLQSFVTREVI